MIDDGNLRDEIYANMQLKTTDELLKIWEENDRKEWTPLAHDVIKEILEQRTGKTLNPPSLHKNIHLNAKSTKLDKPLRNKLLHTTIIVYLWLWLIIFFVLVYSILTGGMRDRTNLAIWFSCLLGLSISQCVMFAIVTYYSWTLDAKCFRNWIADQTLGKPGWGSKFWRSRIADWLLLWIDRLLSPFSFLLSIALVIGLLIAIYHILLG